MLRIQFFWLFWVFVGRLSSHHFIVRMMDELDWYA